MSTLQDLEDAIETLNNAREEYDDAVAALNAVDALVNLATANERAARDAASNVLGVATLAARGVHGYNPAQNARSQAQGNYVEAQQALAVVIAELEPLDLPE